MATSTKKPQKKSRLTILDLFKRIEDRYTFKLKARRPTQGILAGRKLRAERRLTRKKLNRKATI